MTLRPIQITFNAADDASLGQFWAELLGYAAEAEAPGVTCLYPEDLRYPDPRSFGVDLVRVPDPENSRYRVHLDLGTRDEEHYRSLVSRAEELGARRADIGQGEVPWQVLEDPEGNLFCVLSPAATRRHCPLPDAGPDCPIAQVVLHCADPQRAAEFWEAALDWERQPDAEPGVVRFRAPGRVGPWLTLLRLEDPECSTGRAHLDLRPYLGGDRALESERLRALGATDLDLGQGDVHWTVLADPEGNPFCVLEPAGEHTGTTAFEHTY